MHRVYVYSKEWYTHFNEAISLCLYPEGSGSSSVGVLQSDWVQMWSPESDQVDWWSPLQYT